MHRNKWINVLLLVCILDQAVTAKRYKRNIVKALTHLGPDGNKTLGNYVDFSTVLGLDYGNPKPKIRKSYDFIVVGAGPAGCSVANHLSENPSITVLLLELGKSEISIAQDVPATNFFQISTDYNFGYVTEPQTGACLGMKDRRCAWHHGRGLGGSTLINNMIYTRGNWRDYDSWNASGNIGWSYDDVLPYFIRAERANLRDFEDDGFHGKDGYLSVEDIAFRTRLASTFVKSAQESGMRYIDFNRAFGSAKLLMLSGIGPEGHLKDLGIEVIHTLPVGETLYDHPGAIGPVFTVSTPIDNLYNFDSVITVPNFIQYLFGRGVFTSSFTESLAYVKSPVSQYPDPDWPDVELIQAAGEVGDDASPGLQNYFRITDEIMNAYFRPLYEKRAFMYLPLLMHPRTKGSLRLRSTNPYDHPIFDYNYFEDDRDLQSLVYGIKEAIKITSQKPFTDIGVELYSAKVPGCEEFEFNSDGYWRCHVQVLTTTYYHYVATCKMGPATDPSSVVDPRLRVHGIRQLRVVDIGIIPKPPSAHTAAIAYMIGDKGADMIKEDNNL
ncbi:glucose dehydrogenase [FAD, quinone]-like [Ochlerotatus camptorhynchus]|uniref:glucose dehydrogenase [FAD, quinone]-like n=1 Tax=Ochlerotatus camptorhynchus TaxID=644619 RepID=UPI0031D63337